MKKMTVHEAGALAQKTLRERLGEEEYSKLKSKAGKKSAKAKAKMRKDGRLVKVGRYWVKAVEK